ncbi:MAG: FAD:protein FMN transferase [Gammaproteobacteria bacterium]|nr:FAD:protein FMN transferase [Gammaproteobacteria bacterium]
MTISCSTISAVSLALILAACAPPRDAQLVQLQGPTMGTQYTVKLIVDGEFDSRTADAAIVDLLERIENAMSTYRPDSEVSRFNRFASAEWFAVSPQVVDVVAAALEISRLTDGAFDVTVAPLIELWGFAGSTGANGLPDAERIAETQRRIGYQKLSVRTDPSAVRKTVPDVSLNLSAIAKGYAVDRVVEYLERRGIDDYLVEIGGEIKTQGTNQNGALWRIGIEKPVVAARAVQRIITPVDRGVATSGDYRNFFTVDGKRYSHTLNPGTGRPVTHTLASVTVLDETAMRADALATALLVLGPQAGFSLADKLQLPAYFVIREKQGFSERYTDAFTKYLVDQS